MSYQRNPLSNLVLHKVSRLLIEIILITLKYSFSAVEVRYLQDFLLVSIHQTVLNSYN